MDLRLGLDDFERAARTRGEGPDAPITGFLATIPLAARKAVGRFPEYLFPMLRLIWDGREAGLDLLSTNPALALGLVLAPKLKTKADADGWKSPLDLLKMKRQLITRWLEFPGGKATVQLLAKVTKQALFLGHLRTLRALLESPDPEIKKRLSHVDRINPEVLAILESPKLCAHTAPAFLREVSEMRCFEPFLARQLMEVLEASSGTGTHSSAPVFRSIAALEEATEALKQQKEQLWREDVLSRLGYPPPPLPGNGNIEPLTSASDLRRESSIQKNCAANYARAVREGRCYLYRMEQPERCTIEVDKVPGGWRLGQVKATRNQEPALEATWRVIKRWFADGRRLSKNASAVLVPDSVPPEPWPGSGDAGQDD